MTFRAFSFEASPTMRTSIRERAGSLMRQRRQLRVPRSSCQSYLRLKSSIPVLSMKVSSQGKLKKRSRSYANPRKMKGQSRFGQSPSLAIMICMIRYLWISGLILRVVPRPQITMGHFLKAAGRKSCAAIHYFLVTLSHFRQMLS
jgi:hypothetical protein